MELRPHQEDAVKRMHNGSILCGGVGVGKTLTALHYYLQNEAPKDIYVITTAKKRNSLDWESEALHLGITPDRETTMASVITVDSWNNMRKYEEVKDAFFIFDEQRVVGYGAWSKAFIKIARNNRWILLSATPGDVWLDYAPVFIANGFYRNITDFREQHVEYVPKVSFPKVKRYHKISKLERLRDSILVEMPYEKHTTRHEVVVDVEYDKELLRKVVKERWHVYENRPLRDVSELFSVMRKVVYSHDSRAAAVRTLLQKHPKLIVFYNYDFELEILRNLATCTTSSTKTVSESHTCEPSSTQNFETSVLTRSQTPSGTELNPWDYLLSPEGMAANTALLSSTEISSRSQTSNFKPSSTDRDSVSESSQNGTSWSTTQSSSAKKGSTETPTPITSHNERGFALAEWNGHKHEPIPKTDSWVYLVQYRAGAEGWNCIETDAMCFYSPTYSYKDDHQAHGRIDRLNTPFAKLFYYRLLSGSIIEKWVMASLAQKKTFNERALAKTFGEFRDLTVV